MSISRAWVASDGLQIPAEPSAFKTLELTPWWPFQRGVRTGTVLRFIRFQEVMRKCRA